MMARKNVVVVVLVVVEKVKFPYSIPCNSNISNDRGIRNASQRDSK